MLAVEPNRHSKGGATCSAKFKSGFRAGGCEVTTVYEGPSVVAVVTRVEAGWGRQFQGIVCGFLIGESPFRVVVT